MRPPPGLRQLVESYHGCHQPSVAFLVDSWRRALTGHPEAAIIEDDRWTQVSATVGRRSVGRPDLYRLLKATELTDSVAVRRAFVLTLIWGSGTSNPRSLHNLPKALADPDCTQQLVAAAAACRHGDFVSAYANFSLAGVGRSFFTKWFAFSGHVPGRKVQPLILDDRVLRTLNTTFHISTKDMAGTSSRRLRYAAYLDHMHAWSRALCSQGIECSAERLEWILFKHKGGTAIY